MMNLSTFQYIRHAYKHEFYSCLFFLLRHLVTRAAHMDPSRPSSAKMTCEMLANMECAKCKLKVYEVLINIYGAYKLDINAEQGTVKVSGKVNPKVILQLLEGKHPKIKSLKFESAEEPSMGGGYSYSTPHHVPPYAMGSYPYPPYSYPHLYPTGLPYDYPMMMRQPIPMPPLPPLPLPQLPPPPPPPPLPQLLLPPPSSSAAAPQPPKPTLLLEAPPQNPGAAASQLQKAASQPQNSGPSAPPTTNDAKEAVVISLDKKSKGGGNGKCSIM